MAPRQAPDPVLCRDRDIDVARRTAHPSNLPALIPPPRGPIASFIIGALEVREGSRALASPLLQSQASGRSGQPSRGLGRRHPQLVAPGPAIMDPPELFPASTSGGGKRGLTSLLERRRGTLGGRGGRAPRQPCRGHAKRGPGTTTICQRS